MINYIRGKIDTEFFVKPLQWGVGTATIRF